MRKGPKSPEKTSFPSTQAQASEFEASTMENVQNLIKAGQYDQAIKEVEMLVRRFGETPQTASEIGILHHQNGDTDQGEHHLSDTINRRPFKLFFPHGSVVTITGTKDADLERAGPHALKALEDYSQTPQFALFAGLYEYYGGDRAKAQQIIAPIVGQRQFDPQIISLFLALNDCDETMVNHVRAGLLDGQSFNSERAYNRRARRLERAIDGAKSLMSQDPAHLRHIIGKSLPDVSKYAPRIARSNIWGRTDLDKPVGEARHGITYGEYKY